MRIGFRGRALWSTGERPWGVLGTVAWSARSPVCVRVISADVVERDIFMAAAIAGMVKDA